MAEGPSDTILVAIRITLRIRESKVRNPDHPDRRRFVLSEHIFLVDCGSLSWWRGDCLGWQMSCRNSACTYPLNHRRHALFGAVEKQ